MGLIETARALWNVIRNETVEGANTKSRVADAADAILDALEKVETDVSNILSDNVTATDKTWSSQKIADEIAAVGSGNDGITPHIGKNGNWYIGTTDTGVKAQGNNGDNGITPHIGDNGNWYIGTTDTGVKAQGPKGETGEPGNSVESFGFALGSAVADASTITIPISLPYNFTLSSLELTLGVAASGSRFTVDIKKNGTSIFITLISLDSGELSSITSSIPYVLSTTPTTFTTSDVLTVVITQVGAAVAGQAPILWLVGSKTI